jgi:aryl-alcohol dehydrogenase-like predicted oxidoreductase
VAAPDAEEVRLGGSALVTSSLGVGAWSWGDEALWGYRARHGPKDVAEAFLASVKAGVTLVDTAEVYGHGESERIVGWLARHAPRPVQVASKFAPLSGRAGAQALRPALKASLARLRLPRLDLYQLHWADRSVATTRALADALADVYEEGLVGAVGVSNHTASELREAHEALARRGVPLATQQVEYSLLHREPERDGVLHACRELGVTLLAYGPLCQGLLSGAYGPEHPPADFRARDPRFTPEALAHAGTLVDLLRDIGEAHGGRSPAQVALNWLLCQPGVVPLAGARTAVQARENAGALGWRLTPEAVERLDRWDGSR